ncbi:MAG: PEP-CTERM sorting domain-containing protein [Anaerolineae bacterium]|nr:PEP-CTERM sorting domain-containing protein [Anaerolineae bacterium]
MTKWTHTTRRHLVLPITFSMAIFVASAHNIRVFAELYEFDVTSDVYGEQKTIPFSLWIPDNAPSVRGLLFWLPGICHDWRAAVDAPWMAAPASALGLGVLSVDSSALWTSENSCCVWCDPETDEPEQLLESTLLAAAGVSGQPQLANAPLGLIGYSMGGASTLIIASHSPEHVISYATIRGVSWSFPLPEQMKYVPGVLMAGSEDTTINPITMQQSFENYRIQEAQVAYLLHWGHGHSDELDLRNGGQTTEMAYFLLAETMRERYPVDIIPSPEPGNPVLLQDIETESGWLAETPRLSPSLNASSFPEISPYEDYAGDLAMASWIPNNAVANVYRAVATDDQGNRTSTFRVVVVQDNEPLPMDGDFDGDGDVDNADFTAWQAGFGTTEGAVHADGDTDTDGDVDGNDFLIWQQEYGSGSGLLGSAAVPEPASIVLLLTVTTLALARCRWREGIGC